MPLVTIALLLSACDDPEPDPEPATPADPTTTMVRVQFRDSSVPPEYHRSWDLVLDADGIELVVDSYGDVVAKEAARMPAEEWEEFVAGLAEDVEDLGEPSTVDGDCDGGTGMGLDVTGAGDADTSLAISNCNTDGNAEMIERIKEMVRPFSDRVNLEKHARS